MSKPIDYLSFEQWAYFIFDHPVEGPAWHADPDAPYWNGPAGLTAEYVTRLFEDPAPVLEGLTDAEVNNGLWYLISPGLGEHMLCLDEQSLSIETRVRCVRSCESLFRKLFLPRCSSHLSHRDEPGAAAARGNRYPREIPRKSPESRVPFAERGREDARGVFDRTLLCEY
jgi:hypothetical protein